MRVPWTVTALLIALAAGSASAAEDFSAAERAIFLTNHLATLKPPVTLRYTFRKSGSLEAGFEDPVAVHLRAQPDGACCAAAAEFLAGPRRLSLPDVEAAQGNPVILYFLERDIREMNRLTKGQAAYFRKRIRMAVYRGATEQAVQVGYGGKTIAARQFTIAPYLDDPLRPRFEKLAGKTYVFTLSEAVPGGVYSVRARVDGPSPGAPLLLEEMLVDGATRNP
ncbi:MAG: hypothetical protein KF788_08245 [Piscinibacter sp.]|nr:hypothetical protein [Piscinibacter sp.]